MSLKSAAPLEFSARICDMCFEQQTNLNPSNCSAHAVVCVAEFCIVARKSAILVIVRLPHAMQDPSTVVIEPLNSTVVILGRAALPAVCALISDVSRVAVVNNSDKPIEILAGFPVMFVIIVCPVSKSSQVAVTAPCLF